ncbi:MAG TPA: discoidin domain-containing protein, partial [Flavobacteriaceae bacterium]|nr:discoidin domain-containing protein [Flavobacteriaceae bacterium]
YAKSAYTVTSETKVDTLINTVTVNLKNEFPNSDIRYVLNNADINSEAIPFTEPIKITETTSITASLFEDDKPVGNVFPKTYTFDKAVGKKVIYHTKYSDNYPGTGNTTLVNILRGSKNFHDGQWQAWLNKDMDATVDLGEPTQISTVTLGTMENQGPSIFFPTRVEVWVSSDGKKFMPIGAVDRPFKSNAGGAELKDFTITFEPQQVQYVKVKASCFKDNPRGGAWLFVDELIVE